MPNYDDLFASQPAQHEDNSFDKDAWAAQKQAERERIYARIDAYVTAMSGDGEMFQGYLNVQARFDRYSVSNAILIADQMPEATKLADFDSWKASGTYVRRGQDAIAILEPGKEYTRDDGSVGVSCNVKKVFDISQTDSRQQAVPAVSRDERLLLKALMNNVPCGFQIFNALPKGINVAYQAENNVIQVRQGLDAPTIFRGLAQELARAHMEKNGYACTTPAFSAYCVSYMLCKRNGVTVEGFSFDRLPEAYQEMDAQALRSELGVIREIAGNISANMNLLFEVHNRSQKSRDDGAR